jgi:hypothetical protein
MFMGRHPVPEISCIICSEPLDLRIDLSADENGKAVHSQCYVNRLVLKSSQQNASEKTFDILADPCPEIAAGGVAA